MTVKTISKTEAAATKSRLTGEELAAMDDVGPAELVKGELVRMSPVGHPHGFYEGNFVVALGIFVRKHKLGRVLSGEVGIYTGRNPDTIRAADAAFISNERLAQVQSKSYLDIAPELVVEVLSLDDRWSTINQKIDEYFAIGVQQVWIADPDRRQVYVYHSPTQIERFAVGEELSGGAVLPGFKVPVAELFDVEDEAKAS